MKILLKNGKVIDGSGNGSYFADILIENEIIKKIAKDKNVAKNEIYQYFL